MANDLPVTCLADVKAVLGEGPVWVPGEAALYWVDIKGPRIFRCAADGSGLTQWEPPLRVASLASRSGGGFVAGTEHGLARIDLAAGSFDIAFDPEPERTSNRFNDGKLDRAGNFWAGTMDDAEERATGALYRVDSGLGCTRADDGYKVTNGPAFSPDGRLLYHNDSARQVIYRFDHAQDGSLADKRIFAQFTGAEGFPDGMTVDSQGCLWVAFWDGWAIRRFDPDGGCMLTVPMPVARPTSCTFGGTALDQLFVTSASIGLDQKARAMQPYAGGLFVLKPGVAGIADIPFAG